MASRSESKVNLKPDIRSPKGTRIQRGLAIRLLRVLILIFLDVISLIIAWKFSVSFGTKLVFHWTHNISQLPLVLTIEIGIIAAQGLYKGGIDRRNYYNLIKAVSLSQMFLLLIDVFYESGSYFSRTFFIILWFLSVAFICIGRYLFDITTTLLRKKKAICYPVFLISDKQEQESHIKLIQQEQCYIVQGTSNSKCLDRLNREQTFEYLRNQGIVEVFVSWNAIKNRLFICWHFYTAGITLRILPTQTTAFHPKSVLWVIGGVPCMSIPAPIIAGSDFWVKRSFDLCCSIILLLILSPVFALIALLIKLDSPGPILFRQDRIGLHCKKFQICKFRTMVTDAEKMQKALETNNEIKDGVLFKMKDDPRITKVGKFLRRYSLDELPQLLNVLLGQMSLVGPRPLPLRDVDKFQTGHFIRQEVLPGITGWWQVSGRSNIDNFEDAVKLDLSYIENWSIWLDVKILFKTVLVVLNKTGAY
ncbi:exopolysaccharide biosynthesis polyprenyl glycosylphosphotransferase [Brasilonema octagenarum]|uniref:Sugar transferase n=1 Tax=Brasilonema octagenarum UFV-OR1 TaxID=417115 RepID=A0ABX1M0V2_9CYAN|nr:sugar transferase [Brasilonema octagenarum UFV-OR1]